MTTLGVIRWDYGGYGTDSVDEAENDTLRNPAFHSRAPFYATVKNTNSLEIIATQATMDQEIAFALAGGISYWAFLRYINTGVRGDPGLALYQSSSARGSLKWASMEQFGTFGGTADYTSKIGRLITEMQQSHYQKVLTNRPLLYLYYDVATMNTVFGNSATAKTAIDAIRSGAVAAGLGTPYIVMLVASVTAANTAMKATLGLDAMSSYVGPIPTLRNAPYSALRTSMQAYWTALAGASAKIVPIAMSGWNPQPRQVRPLQYQGTQRPWVGLDRVVQLATDSELAAHIAEAKAYAQANPSICDADTILAYSWNEFGEGARPLCPTKGNPTGTHLAGIAAAMA